MPQIEYSLEGNRKRISHVYFLLQVFWVILLFDINVVLMLPCWPDVTIVQSEITIVVPWQLSTGSKHDYFCCYCILVGILFEVLRIIVKTIHQENCLHLWMIHNYKQHNTPGTVCIIGWYIIVHNTIHQEHCLH